MYVLPLDRPSQIAKTFDLSVYQQSWPYYLPMSLQWHPNSDKFFVSTSMVDQRTRRKMLKIFEVGVNVKCAGKWKIYYVKENGVECHYSFKRGAGRKKGHISRFTLDKGRAVNGTLGLISLCRTAQGYIMQRLFAFKVL
jgi:hypothetical protein